MSYADEMIEAMIEGGGDGINGKCQGCDRYCEVSDINLCEDCDEEIQIDFIREKAWDYVVEAFGLSDKGREKLYQAVVKKHGKEEGVFNFDN